MERCRELLDMTPNQEAVENQYQLNQERAKVRQFSTDQQLATVKRMSVIFIVLQI